MIILLMLQNISSPLILAHHYHLIELFQPIYKQKQKQPKGEAAQPIETEKQPRPKGEDEEEDETTH